MGSRSPASPLFVVGLLAAIVALHVTSFVTGWYVTSFWIPVFLHAMGGVWVGSLFLFLANQRGGVPFFARLPFSMMFVLTLGFAAFMGVLWEFFEFILTRTMPEKFLFVDANTYLVDTMGDLTVDLIGASLAFFWYYMRRGGESGKSPY